jgi:hypothetical protein
VNTIFNSKAGTTSTSTTYWPDGTIETPNYNGTTLFYDELNTWYTSGSTIHLQTGGGPFSATYALVNGSAKLSWTEGVNKYSVTFKSGA